MPPKRSPKRANGANRANSAEGNSSASGPPPARQSRRLAGTEAAETPELPPTRKRRQEGDVPAERKEKRRAVPAKRRKTRRAAGKKKGAAKTATKDAVGDAAPRKVASAPKPTKPRVVLDHSFFPHIFDSVFDYLVADNENDLEGVHETLLALRLMNKDLCARVDRLFLSHVIVQGRGPTGVFSKYGRFPAFRTSDVTGHEGRVLDILTDGYHTHTVYYWYNVILCCFREIPQLHWNKFDVVRQWPGYAPDAEKFIKPRKTVRFIDTTVDWSGADTLPPSVTKLVVNIKYTTDWAKWGYFFGDFDLSDVPKIVFIFEPGGEDAEPSANWFFRRGSPFGILTPLMLELVERYPAREGDVLYPVTFVGFPDIPPRFAGLNWNGHDSEEVDDPNFVAVPDPELQNLTGRELLLKRFAEELGRKAQERGPLFSVPEVPEAEYKRLGQIDFLSRDEYVASLSQQEYEEEFVWSKTRIDFEPRREWPEVGVRRSKRLRKRREERGM